MYNNAMDLAHSYYLWLMPDEANFTKYQAIIHNLSKTYTTPCFEPHVTLVSGLSAPVDKLKEKIALLAKDAIAQTLTFTTIEYTHGFFTALYLKAICTDAINQMNQDARLLLNPFGQKEYIPHLSLLYGDITEEEKQTIINHLDFSKEEMTFTKLQLVKGNKDVNAWQIIDAWPLS